MVSKMLQSKNRFRSQFQKAKESCTKVENVEFEGRRVAFTLLVFFTILIRKKSFFFLGENVKEKLTTCK